MRHERKKPGARGQELEVRSQKTAVRGQQSELRSRKCVHVILIPQSWEKNLSSCSRLQPNCRRIPAGDSQSSRGQRPRNAAFPQPDPARVEQKTLSQRCLALPDWRMRPLQGRSVSAEPFRGRCPRLLHHALSGHGGRSAKNVASIRSVSAALRWVSDPQGPRRASLWASKRTLGHLRIRGQTC